MEPTERDHFATISTPRGSVVNFPFLTAEQAQDVADQYGPTAQPAPRPEAAKGESQTCGRCQGAGGWYENVTVKTPSGGEVVTQKWVNCRPCRGTGQIAK
jgi:DnaJ-class molecular chaperone